MQQQSMARRAADEFTRGNYLAALDLYRRLADLLGERNFRANIFLCEKKIKGAGRRDCTQIPLRDIKVACVMDEFTFASYKDTCTLLNLTIDKWASELEKFQPDFLFIESAWRGKDDAWNRKISQASPELLGILEWCNTHKIPTMFWNKEDPVHYGTFLNTAKRFDYVFTTDIGCIANYKKDLGHERVYLLPFACNPVEHNPIEKYERKPEACFAGSYYVRYPERARDLDTLLGTFLEISGVEIYDRQYGKEDVNYAFPEKYKPLILGNLKYEQIDVAYKGYVYGINLNSVKYSPTMFARRVFELLASNTLVVSNYSKGVRLLFGHLVVSSDAKTELEAKIKRLNEDLLYAEKIKLAGLRKVMTEHTYEHRFCHIAEKVLGRPHQDLLPRVHVLATARTQAEVDTIVQTFRSFEYEGKVLHVLTPSTELVIAGGISSVENLVSKPVHSAGQLGIGEDEFVAVIHAGNSYGNCYLVDLAIATKYTNAKVIAKGVFELSSAQLSGARESLGQAYSYSQNYYLDAALVASCYLPEVLSRLKSEDYQNQIAVSTNQREVFFIDRFSFVSSTRPLVGFTSVLNAQFDEQKRIDSGIELAELFRRAESIPPAAELEVNVDAQGALRGSQLSEILDIQAAKQKGVECSAHGLQLRIEANENAASPYYIYAKTLVSVEKLWKDRSGKLFLDTTPGLELAPVVIFFDDQETRIGHTISIANWNQTAAIPSNAALVRFGIRVAGGPGQAAIKSFVFDHASQEHQLAWVQASKQLLITPNYPDYGDYYRYGFVHRRVKAYKDHDLKLDVFRFRTSADLKLYEFEDVDVLSGGTNVLNTVLELSDYSCIAIHALDESMWEIVSKHIDRKKVVIWLHGAEIQSWKRRKFNYRTPRELESARANGERRDEFWRMIFGLRHPNIHFVFVSNHFYHEVISDLGVDIIPRSVHVIHNPIDTELFRYERKDPAQRKRILSIRPYASRVYANDLAVQAIIDLSTRPYFAELKFLLVGDGVLFDETVAPLKDFQNVEIRKGFVPQCEIAQLHREYGVFLCPSRMDTQGVSRDEAMASGLVPVTNRVGAIPEFVRDDAGFLCDEENHIQLANSIETLVFDSSLFERMSESAANSVRQDRSSELICGFDIRLLQP